VYRRSEIFVKRAGFILMTRLTVHDREIVDDGFAKFLPVIEREATDEKNYFRKAVNRTLRQIPSTTSTNSSNSGSSHKNHMKTL
jgi:3-methyladenine DNA glycosylase AlkD